MAAVTFLTISHCSCATGCCLCKHRGIHPAPPAPGSSDGLSKKAGSQAVALEPHQQQAAVLYKRALLSAGRKLYAVKGTESCYSICPTCVCQQKTDELHCCKDGAGSTFSGCIKGNVLKVCRTSRPVNVCCTGC